MVRCCVFNWWKAKRGQKTQHVVGLGWNISLERIYIFDEVAQQSLGHSLSEGGRAARILEDPQKQLKRTQ